MKVLVVIVWLPPASLATRSLVLAACALA